MADMSMNIGIRPTARPQEAGRSEGVQRREDGGGSSSGFSPRTHVSIKNAIDDMAGILSKISSNQTDAVEKMPADLQKVIQNVLKQAFSLEETLGQGLGSTLESQRFSLDQLSAFSRMLSQMGNLAENGMPVQISDQLQALLTNLKRMVGEEGSAAFEPVLLTKAAFELLDEKSFSELPKELQDVLLALQAQTAMPAANNAQAGESMGFLKQLVQYFMPRPSTSGESAQASQNGQQAAQNQNAGGQNSTAQTSQQTAQGNTAQQAGPNGQPAQNGNTQQAGQNGQPAQNGTMQQAGPNGQPAQNGNMQQASQNGQPTQNGTMQQASPNGQPAQNGTMQQTGPNGQPTQNGNTQQAGQNGQPAQNGNMQQAGPNGQPAQNGTIQQAGPNGQAAQNGNAPQAGQSAQTTSGQGSANTQQMAQGNTSQPAGPNGQPVQNSNAQSSVQNPSNSPANGMQNASGQGTAQNAPQTGQPLPNGNMAQNGAAQGQNSAGQSSSSQPSQNTANGQQTVQNPNAQNAQPNTANGGPQTAQANMMRQNSPLAQTPVQQAKLQLMNQTMANTPQTMQTMKNLATLVLQNEGTTQQDALLLQQFVNGNASSLSAKDAKQLQQLIRLCQLNIPATVQQAAIEQNIPDLPRLWAFMQLCDMTNTRDMSGKQLKKAAKDVATFVLSMRNSMGGEPAQATQGQRSLNFMLPMVMGDTTYPSYIYVYDENQQDRATGEWKKETWLRMCVLTENIGAVELTFRVYGNGEALDMHLFFSDTETANEFREQSQELKQNLRGSKLKLQDLKINAVGERRFI